MKPDCLVLFSGGLDSIVACKVLQARGLNVTALKFVTPFFSSRAIGNEQYVAKRISGKYGFDCRVIDISYDYIQMVADPPHGYGKHMNPCIDCKILMVSKAMAMMRETGASFIATGEVPGQRPMSQRRDTLRIIERDSGAEGYLLRPLAASLFKPIIAEQMGLFSSSELPVITGRGRKEQMRLAASFGITDYPSPAGGCVLADPILARRFKRLFTLLSLPTVNDILLARTGRHFLLEYGSWLVVGRNRNDNTRIMELARSGDFMLRLDGAPGPLSVIRPVAGMEAAEQDTEQACNLMIRYVKRRQSGLAVNRGMVMDDGTVDFHDRLDDCHGFDGCAAERLMF